MKFVNSINWTIFNMEDVVKVDCEIDEDNISRYYSYFYLKNGEKLDVYDCPNTFEIEETCYYFDPQCHNEINKIIVIQICDSSHCFIDIYALEHIIWHMFFEWAKENVSVLCAVKK